MKDGGIGLKDTTDPAVVSGGGDMEVTLSKEEKLLLTLNPKFCEYNNINEENFEGELEQTILKYKWDQMGKEMKEKKNTEEDPAYRNIEMILDEEHLEEIEEWNEMEEAKTRMIFDTETKVLDYA